MSQRIGLTAFVVVLLFLVSSYLLWNISQRQEPVDEPKQVAQDPPATPPRVAAETTPRRSPTDDSTPPKDVIADAGERAKPKKTTAGGQSPEAHKAEHPTYPPLFKDWKEPPLATLVISGEQHGYVEPCGCSLNQLGGLSRRADLFRQIKERGWPVTAFDAGGLVSDANRRQAKIKLGMALAALKDLEYAAIALGVEELQTGVDLLQYAESDRPPFLSSNLVLFGAADIGLHVPKLIVTVGSLKIGVTAVFGESYRIRVIPPGSNAGGQPPDIEILDPIESLRKSVAALEAEKPDLLVLLSHARVEETKTYAEAFPQFGLIVSAGGPEDVDPKPKRLGKALFVTPGQKGKNVAVVAAYPGKSGLDLRFEAVALDGDRFQDTPRMQDHMRRYQEALAVQNLVVAEPPIEDPRNGQLTVPNPYVGAKVCGECHSKSYKKWLSTGHARSTESLKTGRAGQEDTWIPRMDDPECIACHVTGWQTKEGYFRYKSGYESEQATPHLVGQQCENCHGPGGRHTELERAFQKDGNMTDELAKFREFAQVFLDEAGQKLCVKCHDGDNDPHFKTDGDVFDRYWQEIKHPWRD
jgi:Cytochrome c554 and c-prime